MAQASNLLIGHDYPVKSGEFKGLHVRVVNSSPVPDGEPHQRKVLVQIIRSGKPEENVYLLPRLIDDGNRTPKEIRKAVAATGAPPALPAPFNIARPTPPQGVTPTMPIARPEAPPAPVVTSVHVPPGTTAVLDEIDQPHPAPQPDVAVYEARPLVIDNDPITDLMDPRLDEYRPDPAIVDAYVGRMLPGSVRDVDALLDYWRKRENVLFVGDTQSGKSMFVRVLAVLAARDAGYPKPLPVFTISGSSGVTDFDMFGQVTSWLDPAIGVERLVWLPGIVSMAAGVGGILELDEIAMMPERVTSSLHPLCDDRRQFVNRGHAVKVPGDGFMPEIVKGSPNLWILGSYNDGYRGSGALQEAFTNRFVHLEWGYDEKVEQQLISSPTILTIGDAIRAQYANRYIATPLGTKALQRFEETLWDKGPEFAIWAFLGMFPKNDRVKVRVTLEDRGLVEMLKDEFETTAGPDLSALTLDDD